MSKICIIEKSFLIRLALKKMIQAMNNSLEIIELTSPDEIKIHFPDLQLILINYKFINNKTESLIQLLHEENCRIVMITNDRKKASKMIDAINIYDEAEIIHSKLEGIIFSLIDNTIKSNEIKILSNRENDILKCVALGLTNKEIADKLFISAHTVIAHRKNISAKLGIKTIAGFTMYALLNKILLPEEVKQN